MYKLQDYRCSTCELIQEHLDDSNNPEEVRCKVCDVQMELVKFPTGTGKKSHISWSKWRV